MSGRLPSRVRMEEDHPFQDLWFCLAGGAQETTTSVSRTGCSMLVPFLAARLYFFSLLSWVCFVAAHAIGSSTGVT
ncbi:unnamed protein product [Linum trigynum]|uniref:Uncharacterized protein n=1 Tax=Linum trigynum TaxID=586398 RepID=A0AAV2G9Y1_9ROSI